MCKPKDASAIKPISLDKVIGISEFEGDPNDMMYTKEYKALVLVLLIRKYGIAREVYREMENQSILYKYDWKTQVVTLEISKKEGEKLKDEYATGFHSRR